MITYILPGQLTNWLKNWYWKRRGNLQHQVRKAEGRNGIKLKGWKIRSRSRSFKLNCAVLCAHIEWKVGIPTSSTFSTFMAARQLTLNYRNVTFVNCIAGKINCHRYYISLRLTGKIIIIFTWWVVIKSWCPARRVGRALMIPRFSSSTR